MRQGKTLTELITEVQRQANTRRDFITQSRYLEVDEGGRIGWQGGGRTSSDTFPLNGYAHGQLAAYADVPKEFYDRIRTSHPTLYATTVNTLLAARPASEKRMVRTLDGNARALLSDRYRCIDNIDLLEQLLPVLMVGRPDIRFASADITEHRLYLKIVSTELEGEVKPGDVVRAGLLLSNSEVGAGAVTVAPFSERLICANGMIHNDLGQRRAHLGRGAELQEAAAWEVFTDETRRADDRAFFLKVRDTIQPVLSGGSLATILDQMRAAAGDKIAGDPAAVVEVVARNGGLSEGERGAVLRNLIEGADLSRWGIANAVTRAAADAGDYDRASELERYGGALLTTPLPVEAPQRVTAQRRVRVSTLN